MGNWSDKDTNILGIYEPKFRVLHDFYLDGSPEPFYCGPYLNDVAIALAKLKSGRMSLQDTYTEITSIMAGLYENRSKATLQCSDGFLAHSKTE